MQIYLVVDILTRKPVRIFKNRKDAVDYCKKFEFMFSSSYDVEDWWVE